MTNKFLFVGKTIICQRKNIFASIFIIDKQSKKYGVKYYGIKKRIFDCKYIVSCHMKKPALFLIGGGIIMLKVIKRLNGGRKR